MYVGGTKNITATSVINKHIMLFFILVSVPINANGTGKTINRILIMGMYKLPSISIIANTTIGNTLDKRNSLFN